MHSAPPTAARWQKSSHSNDQSNCVEVAAWYKSNHSNEQGNCVEVSAWRKSSHSDDQGHCVEVADSTTLIAIRDSKNPDGPVLTFTPADWRAFLRSIRA